MLLDKLTILEELMAQKVREDELGDFNDYRKVTGATDAELDRLEKQFDIKLPEDFRALYKYKNGSGGIDLLCPSRGSEHDIEVMEIYSIDTIIKEKLLFYQDEPMSEYIEDDEWEEYAQWGMVLDERIKPYFFNKRWIPFAEVTGGSSWLMLDFDPTDKGKEGQIIVYVHDPDFVYYVADGVTGVIEQSIKNLKESWDDIY